jgi:hypothetical protein
MIIHYKIPGKNKVSVECEMIEVSEMIEFLKTKYILPLNFTVDLIGQEDYLAETLIIGSRCLERQNENENSLIAA